jgi:hypothetical protein
VIVTAGAWHQAERLSSRAIVHSGNARLEEEARSIVVSWSVIGRRAVRYGAN